MTRNGYYAVAIGHNDVHVLAHYTKPSFLERSNCVLMTDSGYFRHELHRDFNFPDVGSFEQIVACR